MVPNYVSFIISFACYFYSLHLSDNSITFRYIILRMASSGNRLGFGLSLGIKTIAIFSIITALVVLLPLNPVALTCGFSALFLGIVSYTFKQALDKGGAELKKDP